MKVELAAKAGFCFGVNRAVDAVYNVIAENDGPIYTYGPIIHNETVIENFEKKGVKIIDSVDDLDKKMTGTIIIRSHGITREVYETLENSGLKIVDATCPFVKKIHTFVADYSKKGFEILVVGNASHPEVEGIVGWSDKNCTTVIGSAEDAENWKPLGNKSVCVVSQTTFNFNKFQEIVEIVQKKVYYEKGVCSDSGVTIHNTICNATKERQEAANALSEKVDAMIVIGGSSSSNTRKLYEICSKNCKNTYFIQTAEDLDETDFSRFDYVGITAGASTPNNIIEEVQKKWK